MANIIGPTGTIIHDGKWVHTQSQSGQDDTAQIVCSCGWHSDSIWSRLTAPAIEQQFREHKRTT